MNKLEQNKLINRISSQLKDALKDLESLKQSVGAWTTTSGARWNSLVRTSTRRTGVRSEWASVDLATSWNCCPTPSPWRMPREWEGRKDSAMRTTNVWRWSGLGWIEVMWYRIQNTVFRRAKRSAALNDKWKMINEKFPVFWWNTGDFFVSLQKKYCFLCNRGVKSLVCTDRRALEIVLTI